MELVSVVGEGLVGGHEGEILLVESLLDAFTQKNVLRMLSISAFLYPRESFSLAYALRASRWDKVTEFWGYGRGRRSCDEGGMTDTGDHTL